MATVEVHEKPAPKAGRGEVHDASEDPGQLSWEQAREARKRIAITVKDAFGRDIGVGHVSAWDRMRLAAMTTPEEAASVDFMTNAILAFSAWRIGEFTFGRIMTRHEFDQRCEMLDDEGFAALWKAWIEVGWFKRNTPTEQEASAEADRDKDQLKNSAATPLSPTQRG